MDVDKIKSADANSPSIRDQDNGPLASRSSSDVEKASSSIQAGETVQLQRKLQSRHLQMIAIGIISPYSSWRFPGTFEIERERERDLLHTNTHCLSRWHNRHRSLHWQRRSTRNSRSRGIIDRVRICRYHCLLCHGSPG